MTITLTATCNTTGAQPIPLRPARHAPVRAAAQAWSPRTPASRYYTFPGGCATYQLPCARRLPALATTVDTAVAFMPRSELASYV